MAKPLKTGKAPVSLADQAARPSKIRRDPPPVVRKTVVPDRELVDKKAVAVGVVAFGLAITIIVLAFGGWAGWSPSQYTVEIKDQPLPDAG